MPKLKLHLDHDVSRKAVQAALIRLGHDVTRTPNEWIKDTAPDLEQLLQATAHGRCIVTFNVRDFIPLSQQHLDHCGILIGKQNDWSSSQLIVVLNCILTETDADDWIGQVRWLNEWRTP